MRENERFVHDLVWAVNSPFLMDLTGYMPVAAQTLKIGDVDRVHLTNYLTNHREKRVGRYFERLIVYWIRYLRGCEIVAQTLQLRDGTLRRRRSRICSNRPAHAPLVAPVKKEEEKLNLQM